MTPSEAFEIIDEIVELADSEELPANGVDFAESVSEKASDIGSTIEEMDCVTDAQAAALENMRDGLRRWFRE